MLGVQDIDTGSGKWQVSGSWRYQYSHRHFVGPEEQLERAEDRSQVKNTINLFELGVRYNASDQWSFALGIPYLMAERSSPLRDSNRVVVDRTITEANSLGDITLTARRMLWKPQASPKGNISLGLGIKFPTGDYDVFDDRVRLVNGQRVVSEESVDQSIQPGDGGTGVILDFQGYRSMARFFSLYGSATYLVNPRGTNGTPTFRTGIGEEVMSVADQYVARIGGSFYNPAWKGFGFSLGGRLEGVPVEDLIGDSEGFRRPGYAISAEPGMSYTRGPSTVSLAVPIALYRNRTRSVPDRMVPGRHGDAAFADYVIFLGYFRRY